MVVRRDSEEAETREGYTNTPNELVSMVEVEVRWGEEGRWGGRRGETKNSDTPSSGRR